MWQGRIRAARRWQAQELGTARQVLLAIVQDDLFGFADTVDRLPHALINLGGRDEVGGVGIYVWQHWLPGTKIY